MCLDAAWHSVTLPQQLACAGKSQSAPPTPDVVTPCHSTIVLQRLISKGLQVNGGANVGEKVDFAFKHFEQPIPIDAVLRKDEMIDTIAITRGRGTEGVVTRWGVTRLPRKTHRGLRKVSQPFHSGFLSPSP